MQRGVIIRGYLQAQRQGAGVEEGAEKRHGTSAACAARYLLERERAHRHASAVEGVGVPGAAQRFVSSSRSYDAEWQDSAEQ